MSSPGSPKAPPVDNEESRRPRPSMGGPLGLVLAAALVLIALVLASQFIGVLYAIVFPQQPPRPGNIAQLEHVSESYGVDEWLYATADDACAVARFFQQNGGSCQISPGFCGGQIEAVTAPSRGTNIAQCRGESSFSIFEMEWYANIATGYGEETPTRLRLSREVYWTGNIPQPTPTPGG